MGDTSPTDSRRLVVRTLLCKAHVPTALRCLTSLMHAVDPPPRLVVHSDGTLDQTDIDTLIARLGTSVRFVSRKEADDLVLPQIASFPVLQKFRAQDPLALKLLDVSLIGSEERIAFVDSDVCFLCRINDLFPTKPNQALFMGDVHSDYSIPWKHWRILGRLHVRRRINTGLFAFPRAHFDLEYANHILSIPAIRAGWQAAVEQTVWACLAARLPTCTYNIHEVVLVNEKTVFDPRIKIAHFVTGSRFRLNEVGASNLDFGQAKDLTVASCGNLSRHEFLLERFAARARRLVIQRGS